MAEDRIEIEIVLDDGSIKKGFANLKQESKKLGDSLQTDIGASFSAVGTKIAAASLVAVAAASAIAGVITKRSIEAAAQYEDIVNKFNVALAASGQFSKEASNGFLEFASALQKTTKFSDDQVLSSAALIQNIARLSNDGLKQATKASLDLAAALGIDLESAAQLVGKSANGNVSALARYGVEVRKGKNDTETFANTLKTLESRFAGAAEASAKTFTGSLDKLKNAFEDIFKEIGRAIVKSPSIAILINQFSAIFSTVSETIKNSIGKTDVFKDFIINFSVVAQAGAETARAIGVGFELAFLRAQQAFYAFKVASTLGFSDAFNQELSDINDKIDEVNNNFSQDSAITTFFDNLILKVSETTGKLNEFTDGVKNNLTPGLAQVSIGLSDAATAFGAGFASAVDYSSVKLNDFGARSGLAKEQFIKDFKSIGDAAKQGLGNAIGGGFAAFGKALVTGENALNAFAKAFIGAIGQAAISEGAALILRGIGYSFDPFLAGFAPGMIAAGSALATFGGVLTAIGGGGASSTAGGSGGGSGAGTLSSPEAGGSLNEAPKINDKTTKVEINVAGTVLDPISVGRQISQILSDTFEATGTKVVTA